MSRHKWRNSALDVRARAAAEAVGLKARRSYWRVGSRTNLGGFALWDPSTDRFVAGKSYELTPGDVVDFCSNWTTVRPAESEH